MSLREYQKKRDFAITAEPAGQAQHSPTGRLFVVQKHDASRLHYDFRLEMGGVLKSWAVPKGFSPQRGERRLAVHVEDHPLDYADFEGIIPAGQYGGGTVMVWDYGTYETEGDAEKGLAAGKLRCTLSGQKLVGEWTLVHTSHDEEEKTWFLIKTGEDVEPLSKKAEEHSVLTGRTLAQIAAQKDAVWNSNRGLAADERAAKKAKPSIARKKAPQAVAPPPKKKSLGRAKPHWIEPMKATLTETPPQDDGWVFELKWDGYRALVLKTGTEVEILSRNQKSLTADFPEVRDAVAQLPAETAVLDGEICALDSQGRPSFQLLQARALNEARPALYFYAFDLLQLEGHSFLERPLLERKKALAEFLAGAPETVRNSAPLDGNVEDLLAAVRAQGLEGLIGKRADSLYRPGVRTRDWIKLKVSREQEFVVGGFTPPKGSRQYLGALLLGYYRGKTLHFAGKVGTGFNDAWLKRLHALGQKIEAEKCPFADLKAYGGKFGQGMTATEIRQCRWLKPKLVAQIRFAEWTNDGLLRHAVFLGLRKDKAARDVVREG